MRTAASLMALSLCLASQTPSALQAAPAPDQTSAQVLQTPSANTQPIAKPQPKDASFNAFTGKIIRNKVRMRIQPNLDSPILRELNRNDMLIVVGEVDDFYAVQCPSDVKGYVFRTFVLDDVVEGDKVNVRLEPDTAAPVIAQLNCGERVKSCVSSLDKKWLEIPPPNSTRFYVCKDYVEKIGDPTLMTTIERRRDEATDLLNESYLASQIEMQKPFEQIHLDDITQNLNTIINDYADFPAQAGRAKEILASTQEAYLHKKIAYMEANPNANNSQTAKQAPQSYPIATNTSADSRNEQTPAAPIYSNATSYSMTRWNSTEQQLYAEWVKDHPSASIDDFYRDQLDNATAFQGIIEPYNRTVKNKPGDYLLVSQASHLPIAYLYSSTINLDAQVGHEVTIHVAPRDNHNFAFPAYFVLSVE